MSGMPALMYSIFITAGKLGSETTRAGGRVARLPVALHEDIIKEKGAVVIAPTKAGYAVSRMRGSKASIDFLGPVHTIGAPFAFAAFRIAQPHADRQRLVL